MYATPCKYKNNQGHFIKNCIKATLKSFVLEKSRAIKPEIEIFIMFVKVHKTSCVNSCIRRRMACIITWEMRIPIYDHGIVDSDKYQLARRQTID